MFRLTNLKNIFGTSGQLKQLGLRQNYTSALRTRVALLLQVKKLLFDFPGLLSDYLNIL